MSLVGSLEDLNLGDILQIVSLSRKSGTLQLRSGAQRGRILMVEGLVRAGSVEGEASSLRDILVDGGFLSDEEFKLAAEAAAARGEALEQALSQRAGLEAGRLESLQRDQVEHAVFVMLGWRSGEFSFEVWAEDEPPADEPLLETGINAQYLAMEATRLGDETPAEASAEAAVEVPEAVDEFVFSGEGDGEVGAVPVTQDLESAADEVPVFSSGEAEIGDEDATASFGPAHVVPQAVPARSEEVPDAEPAVASPELPNVPLVVIDREPLVREWLKSSLDGQFERIHAFQEAEAGIGRVRQYLARLVRPVVLLSGEAAEPRQTRALVRRLQKLATGMPVLLLCDARSRVQARSASGVLRRPPIHQLANRRQWSRLEAAGRELREALAPWAAGAAASSAVQAASAARLERLKLLSRQLRDPTQRPDVLSLVLGFAAESLPRVAIFMVRDGEALGMAQQGLARAGGPDDEALRQIRVPVSRTPCLRAAVEQRSPQRLAPRQDADRRLAELLGERLPAELYLAPIESGGEVAALVYADRLPESRPVGDTRLLDRLLREAGLALDRALRERSPQPADRAPADPEGAA